MPQMDYEGSPNKARRAIENKKKKEKEGTDEPADVNGLAKEKSVADQYAEARMKDEMKAKEDKKTGTAAKIASAIMGGLGIAAGYKQAKN